MNRIAMSVGILILLVAVGGTFFLLHTQSVQTPRMVQNQAGEGNASVGANGQTRVVTYTDSGFSPSSVTVAPGTTITWTNQSTHMMWVKTQNAADNECDDDVSVRFNECEAVQTGGSFSHTFTKEGSFGYANREQSADTATVVVSMDAPTTVYMNPASLPN